MKSLGRSTSVGSPGFATCSMSTFWPAELRGLEPLAPLLGTWALRQPAQLTGKELLQGPPGRHSPPGNP